MFNICHSHGLQFHYAMAHKQIGSTALYVLEQSSNCNVDIIVIKFKCRKSMNGALKLAGGMGTRSE